MIAVAVLYGCLDSVEWNGGLEQWNGLEWWNGMECQYRIVQNIQGTKLSQLNGILGKRFVVVPCQ